jgi:photosystem II stability/assembly factor-like uncharacterized protein
MSFYSQRLFEIWTKWNSPEIQAIAVEREISLWKVETAQNAVSLGLDDVYFFDEHTGYAYSNSNLGSAIFNTTDGGKSWEKISSLEDFVIQDLFFFNQSDGIGAMSRLSSPENGSYLMRTKDGGKNWEQIYSTHNERFRKITFNPEGLGMVVGSKSTSNKWFSTHLVLLTKDGGKTWVDISENLNSIALNSAGRIDDSLVDTLFSRDNTIFVLSTTKRIYESSDEGKSWKLHSKLLNEPAQTGIRSFGKLDDGKLWLAGGAISEEGKWGMVAISNNRLGWDTYRLNDYYFSDVKFLSENEVVACGVIVAKHNFGGANEQNTGVILYSTDSGKSWSIIHKSQRSNKFNSITKISENKLFVTENNGTGVFLEKTSNVTSVRDKN